MLCLSKLVRSYLRWLGKKKSKGNIKHSHVKFFCQTKTSLTTAGSIDHFTGDPLPLVVNSHFRVSKSPKWTPKWNCCEVPQSPGCLWKQTCRGAVAVWLYHRLKHSNSLSSFDLHREWLHIKLLWSRKIFLVMVFLSLKMSSLGLEGSKHIKHKGHIGVAEMTLNEFYITLVITEKTKLTIERK